MGHANAAPARTVTGITYGGVALTAARQDTNTPSGVQWLNGIWYLLAPAVGAANIVISLSGSVQGIGACGISAYAVKQSTPVDGAGAATGGLSPLSVNITPTRNTLLVDSLNVERAATGTTVAGGQTERANVDTTSQIRFGCSTKLNTGSATSMGWTWSGGQTGAITTVPFVEAVGGGFLSLI